MEPSQYLAALRRRWVVIAIVALVCAIAGLAVAKTTTPTYRSTTQVFVSTVSGDTVGELVQGSTYTQNLVQSYAQLVNLPIVLDPVIDQLDLNTTARALSGSISADTPLNTVVIEISVVSASPERAARIADAVAVQLGVAVTQVTSSGAAGEPSVRIQTVAPATVPTVPIAPNTRLTTVTGLLLGLALGVVLALVRELLDTKVRSTEDVARVTSAAVLSTVPFTKGPTHRQIVMTEHSLTPRAESYRRLRANLQYVGAADGLRSFVVTSALPGEGKSTMALNLALALAEGHSRVLLVDADLRRPSIAEYTGLEGSVGLTTVLIGKALSEDVVQRWGPDNLDILTSGGVPPNPSQLLDSAAMAALLEELAGRYDTLIIDSAPLLPVTDSAILARLTDGAVVVAGSKIVTRKQLGDALASLEALGSTCLGVVLNQVRGKDAAGSSYGYGPEGPVDGDPAAEAPSSRTILRTASTQATRPAGTPTPAAASSRPGSAPMRPADATPRTGDPLAVRRQGTPATRR